MKFTRNNNFILSNYINKISNAIKIPKFLTDKFRTEIEAIERLNNPSKYDNLDDFLLILQSRFLDIKNSLFDIKSEIDRNNLKIEEFENVLENKNDKINFLAYSEKYTSTKDVQNPILKKSLDVNVNELIGIIADEDSGIEALEYVEDNKSYIKLNIDDSKIDGIKFVTNSSVKINWNPTLKAYELLQNDIFQYVSHEEEKEIIIDHNLGTRALDIKVFKHDLHDLDMRYPIMVGMEYPSDNQVRLYLTSKQLISVLISRI